ncbi:hypothetical protein CVN68_02895 [Sphingomonas psychrotolerans]|uniref:Uncharacterized protein n=1 Tax=Sphingomonas psychrotolerans TaxID=1327635 RepID=A0A2K8MH38_9SPHN|nr:hypothetical protein CVN68_02895 [Sphingomonas psychrotolerans]
MRLRDDALPKKREQQCAKHDEPLRPVRPGRARIPLRPTCGSMSLIGSIEGRDAGQPEPASAWVQCGVFDMLYCLITQVAIRLRPHSRNAGAQDFED